MDEEQQHLFSETSGLPCDLMLRLYLLIKAQPDIVNQKFTLFDGSERSFADLMADDGQQEELKHKKRLDMSMQCISQICPSLLRHEGDVLLMKEIFHKIRINANAITDEGERIGKAISIPASAVNHSCRQNAGFVVKGRIIELRAMRNVAVGEEVTNNYTCNQYTRKERHDFLAQLFAFICKCDRCEAGDTPGELEDSKRMHELEKIWNKLDREKDHALMFEITLVELRISEKIDSQFHPLISRKMMNGVLQKLFYSKSFTETDGKNLLMLMEKLMIAWPITHGTDHRRYPCLLKLNEEITQKFGKKPLTASKLVMTESTNPAHDHSAGTPGMKATKKYNPGDVTISDKHFAHVVRHDVKRKYCDNCLKSL
jgi:hypothetical protein